MLELELQQYLHHKYPQENARCEWKEFKNQKKSFCGDEKDDAISYVSAIANMERTSCDRLKKTLEIVGSVKSRRISTKVTYFRRKFVEIVSNSS